MRRALAVTGLLVLIAREAQAQVGAGQSARIASMSADMGVQATLDTTYLLALCMAQLAAAGSAPSQGDIDEATRAYFAHGAAYFTNGAAATGVPTSGPGAAYFTNGAEVTAYSPSAVTEAPEAAGAGVATLAGDRYEQDAGSEDAAATPSDVVATEGGPAAMQPAPPAAVQAEPTSTGPTCSPMEIEAAMAIARQFAAVAPSPASAAPCTPSPVSTFVPSRAQTAPTFAPASNSSVGPVGPTSSGDRPSLFSRLAFALSGAFFGGLAVALWLRPRPMRVARPR
jgi:hypothetical protein